MSLTEKNDMYETSAAGQELYTAITRALEAPPNVRVPAEFAARLRTMLPPPAPVRRPQSSAFRAGTVAVVLLLVAAFCLAPHAAPRLSSLVFDVELGLIVELAGVMAWLANVRRGT